MSRPAFSSDQAQVDVYRREKEFCYQAKEGGMSMNLHDEHVADVGDSVFTLLS